MQQSFFPFCLVWYSTFTNENNSVSASSCRRLQHLPSNSYNQRNYITDYQAQSLLGQQADLGFRSQFPWHFTPLIIPSLWFSFLTQQLHFGSDAAKHTVRWVDHVTTAWSGWVNTSHLKILYHWLGFLGLVPNKLIIPSKSQDQKYFSSSVQLFFISSKVLWTWWSP